MFSPMMYVIMVEMLKTILEHERATGKILGLKIEGGVRRINKS
jgi:hypothetical protein